MTSSTRQQSAWFKSSRSHNAAGCVEVRFMPEAAEVRDSKDRTGPVLAVEAAGWAGFTGAVKAGVYDLVRE